MSSYILKKVEEIQEIYSRKNPPILLEPILSGEGIKVIEWYFAGGMYGVYINKGKTKFIGVEKNLTAIEKRVVIAHELGHHFLHSGNHLCMPEISVCQQEYRAQCFAAHLLIPQEIIENIIRYEYQQTEDLPFYFEVTQELMSFKLKLLKKEISTEYPDVLFDFLSSGVYLQSIYLQSLPRQKDFMLKDRLDFCRN